MSNFPAFYQYSARNPYRLLCSPMILKLASSLLQPVTQLFSGIILAGTCLSMSIVKVTLGSVSAKGRRQPLVFSNTGHPSQEIYICRYLTLSDNDIPDRRLLERMLYWFSGRHRLTAYLNFYFGKVHLSLATMFLPRSLSA